MNSNPRRVLFINPRVLEDANASPPLGMLYVIAYAREHFPHYEFQFADWMALKPSESKQKEILRERAPAIVGISTFSPYLTFALDTARVVKETLPDCKVVLGGPHTTIRPHDKYPNADCVVAGEGELAFAKLLELHDRGADFPSVLHNQEYLGDIDFPPAIDVVERWDCYGPKGFFFGVRHQAWVIGSRGCPYSCTFCSNPIFRGSRPRVRFRTPAKLIEEIRTHMTLHKTHGVCINDDEFNTNVQWARQVCREMIASRLGLPWAASLRTTERLFPEDLVALMKRSGCRAVALGIESGNDEVLESIRKGTTRAENLRALRLLKKHRIIAHGMFIIGHAWRGSDGRPEGETLDQLNDTLAFIRGAARDGLLPSVSISVCLPLPGSDVGDLAAEFDLMYTADVASRGLDTVIRQRCTFKHPRLTAQQIQTAYQQAWESVALNAPQMIGRLLNVSSLSELADNLRLGTYVAWKLVKGRAALWKSSA